MDVVNRTKNKLEIRWSFVLYLFCFIFAPPLVPVFNFVFIVSIYSVFMLFSKYKKQVKEVYYKSQLKNFFNLLVLAYVYLAIITITTILFDHVNISNYIKIWYRFFLITPIMLVCILYIILRCRELGYSLNNLLLMIILAGMLQATLSILMLISPPIKSLLVSIIYANTGDQITQNPYAYIRRYYAFANGVLDSFGYGVGIISALPLYLALIRKVKYLWFVPFLLIVPLLNSRTGLVIFVIGLLFTLPAIISSKISFLKLYKITFIVLSLIFLTIQSFKVLKQFVPQTMTWVQEGLDNLITVIQGDTSGNESVSKLFADKFWFFPKDLQLMAGTGHNVYEAVGYPHSDVGYVNDIWLGGIIGILLLYFPIIKIFSASILKNNDYTIRFLLLFLLLSLLIVNMKGIMINYNVGMAVTLPIVFYSIFTSDKENELVNSN